ncbi:hypothetical protein SFUMM280S_07784 [Streptomyces fumanus]
MNKLHGNSTSAVVTRLHDVQGRGPERTGAEGGTPRASAFERGEDGDAPAAPGVSTPGT